MSQEIFLGLTIVGKFLPFSFANFSRDDKLATGEGHHNISLSSEDYVTWFLVSLTSWW